MFDEVDRKLEAWAQSVVPGLAVTFAPPAQAAASRGMSLYLFELVEDRLPRGDLPAALRLALRYLVTTWGEPAEAHRWLGDLAFGALADPELTAELRPPPAALWSAWGTPPRPAFVLRARVSRARDAPVASEVQHPIVARVDPHPTGAPRERHQAPNHFFKAQRR